MYATRKKETPGGWQHPLVAYRGENKASLDYRDIVPVLAVANTCVSILKEKTHVRQGQTA